METVPGRRRETRECFSDNRRDGFLPDRGSSHRDTARRKPYYGLSGRRNRMSKRLSLQKREKEGMQSQIIWGLALTLLGGVVAGAAIAWLPVLLIYAIPLIAIGVALIIWRGREEILEPVEE